MISPNHYPKRKTIRLPDYDYTQPGFHFITICAQDHLCLFGEIISGEMKINTAGHLLEIWWEKLSDKYNVELDCHIVMPNHFHRIVVIPDEEDGSADMKTGAHVGTPLQQIVRWFKTMTTNEYIRNVKTHNWAPFRKRLWQRNYYEHVIRGDKDLTAIREYIRDNPLRWELDKENPQNIGA